MPADDLTNFFIRIEAHNRFFGNVPYDLIGFAYNRIANKSFVQF